MKRLDDLEAKREHDADFTGEKYISRFSVKYKVPGSREDNQGIDKSELRWSNFKHLNMSIMAKEILMPGKLREGEGFPFLISDQK